MKFFKHILMTVLIISTPLMGMESKPRKCKNPCNPVAAFISIAAAIITAASVLDIHTQGYCKPSTPLHIDLARNQFELDYPQCPIKCAEVSPGYGNIQKMQHIDRKLERMCAYDRCCPDTIYEAGIPGI